MDTKKEKTWVMPVAVTVSHIDGVSVDETAKLKEPVELTPTSAPSENNGSEKIAVQDKLGDISNKDVKRTDIEADIEHQTKDTCWTDEWR